MQRLLSFKYSKVIFFVLFVLSFFVLRYFLLKEKDDRLTFIVNRDSLVDTIKVSSVYSTAMQKDIFSTADGVITELFVRNGDTVEKGDKLFHVESTSTEEEKAVAYAVYMKSLKTYNEAKQTKFTLQSSLEKERQKILDARSVSDDKGHDIRLGDDNPDTGRKYTREEIDSKDSALISARYNFTAVEKKYLEADQIISSGYADFKSKKLAYDATKSIDIISPAFGKIVNLLKGQNDGVSISDTDKPVLVIANLDNPSLIVPINELYISRVEVGQETKVVFDAYKQQSFRGVIESVDTIGNDDGVISYDAKISLFDITSEIRPGMTAIVSIETLRKDNVLSIPSSAVGFDDEKAYVYRLSTRKEEKVEVKLGVKGISDYEVISGLEEEDIILANIGSGR
jgi:HlyD family secretion protein